MSKREENQKVTLTLLFGAQEDDGYLLRWTLESISRRDKGYRYREMSEVLTELGGKGSRCFAHRYHHARYSDIVGLLLMLYVGTSPVYWFWTLPVEWINASKVALFLLACGSVWLVAMLRDRIRFPSGLAGPLGPVLLICLHFSAFIQSEPEVSLRRCMDIFSGYVMLWSIYLFIRMGGDIRKVLSGAGLLLLPFCALTITYTLFGFPDWSNPYSPYSVSRLGVGFGGERTGWSSGIALFFPIALLATAFNERLGPYKRLFGSIASVGLIIGSQLASGGRSGLLASLATVVVLSVSGRIPKTVCLLSALIALAGYKLAEPEWILQHLRLGRLEGVEALQDLDYFSAYRIEDFLLALRLVGEHPALGYGIADPELFGLRREIHNVWLRMAMQAGILAPACFGAIVYVLIRNASCVIAHKRPTAGKEASKSIFGLTVFSTLLGGLIISMFEPNALIGSFQNSVLWWVAGGAAVACNVSDRPRKKGKYVERAKGC